MTACRLVTEQDASAALGRAAGRGTAGGTAALSECIYDNGSLIVSMKTDSKALYDTSYAQAHAKGAADVPSVGDSAFQYSAGTAFSGVEFLRGTTLVTVLAGGAGAGNAALAAAKIAALEAVRMPPARELGARGRGDRRIGLQEPTCHEVDWMVTTPASRLSAVDTAALRSSGAAAADS